MRLDRLSSMEFYILQKGSVSLENLAEHFQLSVNTARRDIIELEKRGGINRVRGGAVAKALEGKLEKIGSRQLEHVDSKHRIGLSAAALTQSGQAVYVDAGTTAKYVVANLAKLTDLTIITHSVDVMLEAVKLTNATLIVLGGEYSPHTNSFHSYSSIMDLSNFNIDIAFLGTTGITVEGGFTTATFMEAAFKSSVMKRARETVIMADRSKFGASSTSKFAELADATTIITDGPIPGDILQYCSGRGQRVVLADAAT